MEVLVHEIMNHHLTCTFTKCSLWELVINLENVTIHLTDCHAFNVLSYSRVKLISKNRNEYVLILK